MRHERHFGSANDVALRDVARISALISDIDRHVRLLDCDIAAEEERARVSDHRDAAYPILARTLATRRDNLKETIAALEKWLGGLQAISATSSSRAYDFEPNEPEWSRSRRDAWPVQCVLCRYRHKGHNAEPRIMPREPRFPRETQPDQ